MNADIKLENGNTSYLPGEPIRGVVQWHLEEIVERIELRLMYHTSGKGTQDAHTVAREQFARPGASESRPFELTPDGAAGPYPWSFSGKLVSVIWGLELVIGDETLAAECALIVSPTGDEINLYAHDDGSAQTDATKRLSSLMDR